MSLYLNFPFIGRYFPAFEDGWTFPSYLTSQRSYSNIPHYEFEIKRRE